MPWQSHSLVSFYPCTSWSIWTSIFYEGPELHSAGFVSWFNLSVRIYRLVTLGFPCRGLYLLPDLNASSGSSWQLLRSVTRQEDENQNPRALVKGGPSPQLGNYRYRTSGRLQSCESPEMPMMASTSADLESEEFRGEFCGNDAHIWGGTCCQEARNILIPTAMAQGAQGRRHSWHCTPLHPSAGFSSGICWDAFDALTV